MSHKDVDMILYLVLNTPIFKTKPFETVNQSNLVDGQVSPPTKVFRKFSLKLFISNMVFI